MADNSVELQLQASLTQDIPAYKPPFSVDPSLINECEIAEKLVFEPLQLKRTIDKWMAEVEDAKAHNWVEQKATDKFKLWVRW